GVRHSLSSVPVLSSQNAEYLPLFLEQLMALDALATSDELPHKLADVVMRRLERLEVYELRLLQAVAILGNSCDLTCLGALLDDSVLRELDALHRKSLVFRRGDKITVAHPFVRELVELSIPAGVRRELHRRAFEIVLARQEALEVRAEHAFYAGEP